ncbi:putative ribonuclease H-like domain-containing protein [Tanacetum coccineum]
MQSTKLIHNASTEENIDAVKSTKAKNAGEEPNKHPDLKPVDMEDQVFLDELERLKRQEQDAYDALKPLRKVSQDTEICLFKQEQQKLAKISEALEDESWVDVMQEELLQFKIQKVWILVDLPYGKKAIGTKWVYRNKKDERGVVVRNKARLGCSRHMQRGRIDYDEDFALVARLKLLGSFRPLLLTWEFISIRWMTDIYVGQARLVLGELILGQFKKQPIVVYFDTEAEYFVAAELFQILGCLLIGELIHKAALVKGRQWLCCNSWMFCTKKISGKVIPRFPNKLVSPTEEKVEGQKTIRTTTYTQSSLTASEAHVEPQSDPSPGPSPTIPIPSHLKVTTQTAKIKSLKAQVKKLKKSEEQSKRRSIFKQGRKTVNSSKGADEGTDLPKVSTARTKLSIDKFEEGTAEPEPRENERKIKEMNEVASDPTREEDCQGNVSTEGTFKQDVVEQRGITLVVLQSKRTFYGHIQLSKEIMPESLIEVTDQGDFWNDQQDWEIVTWRLYEACGVCILEFKDGTVIHMLVERKYPLSKEFLPKNA